MKHNCTLCQGASVLILQVLLNRITSHQKAKIIHSQDHTHVEIHSSCPAETNLHFSTFYENEFQICTAQGACYQRNTVMSAVSVQTDSVVDGSVDRTTSFSQTVLDSSSIITELPDNSEQSFLLDMSNWQGDLTKFGIVFTGPNGETFLPPNSFARLDSCQ